MRFSYPAFFDAEEEGDYSIWFPDLQGAYTCSDDMAEGAKMAAEVLELVLEFYLDEGKPLPRPSFDIEVPKGSRLVVVSVEVDSSSRLVATAEAAKLLGVSNARVRQLVLSGKLVATKQGKNTFVYLKSIRDRLTAQPKSGRPRIAAAL